MLSKTDFAFDCYQSRWSKENKTRGRLADRYSLGTNDQCNFKSENVVWTVYPNAVNATFRCEKNQIIGEYTVSVFEDKDTPYGHYYCNTAHFSSSEKHEIGSVTDKLKTPY